MGSIFHEFPSDSKKKFLYVSSPFIGSPHPFRNFLNMVPLWFPSIYLEIIFETMIHALTHKLSNILLGFSPFFSYEENLIKLVLQKKFTSLRVSISQKIRELLINQNLIGPRNSFKRHKQIP